MVPSFDDLRASLVAELKAAAGSEQLWTAWLVGILTAADVKVEPEYGTWTTDPAPNVIPPGR